MVASENDALIGGKVGGVGDVVSHLPRVLASMGWLVTVITPSYGFLHQRNPSTLFTNVTFPFRGKPMEAAVWESQGKRHYEGVRHLVIEHEQIRGDSIYYNDPPETPFLRDATKYAMFCSAVGRLLATMERPTIVQLHDWHAAAFCLLRELHPEVSHLHGIPTAFTIHNLAIQGTRPMRGLESSVEGWFPELFEELTWIAGWKDPRYRTPCF